jgi:hypothetical protein
MRPVGIKSVYVAARVAAFLCFISAIISAFAGAHVAGPLMLAFLAFVGLGAVLNVYVGFAEKRVYAYAREITKESQPEDFKLWLFLNVFLVFVIGLAAIAIFMARSL